MNADPYKIHIIRDADCPHDETCEIVGILPARPGKVQAVGTVVTDQALLAAYRHKIGSGEALFEMDAATLHGLDLGAGA